MRTRRRSRVQRRSARLCDNRGRVTRFGPLSPDNRPCPLSGISGRRRQDVHHQKRGAGLCGRGPLAAAEQLDGTSVGVTNAQTAATSLGNKWNFGTTAFTGTTVEVATLSEDPPASVVAMGSRKSPSVTEATSNCEFSQRRECA